jgi:DNA-binding NtrC family response regulator
MLAPPTLDVLVVEDDRLISELLLHAIQDAGLTTDVAGNVVEAKRLLARGSYRVLVLDLILPDGTGYDVLDFIQAAKLPTLPIIVITAAEPSLLARLDRAMVKSVMFKPLDTQHFIDVVRAMALERSNHVH